MGQEDLHGRRVALLGRVVQRGEAPAAHGGGLVHVGAALPDQDLHGRGEPSGRGPAKRRLARAVAVVDLRVERVTFEWLDVLL